MTNEQETTAEKLKKLNLNKETLADLDDPNAQHVKGGALSILPGCPLPTGPVACPGTVKCIRNTGLIAQ